jgi:2-methylisocitrate lyase-like PEP mutase family enzyme
VVAAGFPVVATSSGAVADALGYEDEQGAPAKEMLAAAARITRAVDVPVTVDAEAGYGMGPGELVVAMAGAGAAGCNLEDTDHTTGSLRDPDRQAEWLASVRDAAREMNYGLVVNARVDVFLADRATPQADLLDHAEARARAYLAAGADCIFPIFLSDEQAIAAFVQAVGAPVNILATQQAPPTGRLAELGVARVSYGSGLMRRTMEALELLLAELPR